MIKKSKKTLKPFAASLYFYWRKLLGDDTKFILIFSHIRGYTTLLSHIMGSHPGINGYREYGISYINPIGLYKLLWTTRREPEASTSAQYSLDKILHGEFEVSDRIIKRPDVKIIISVREPLETIKSILSLNQLAGLHWTQESASDYYCNRLDELGDIMEIATKFEKAPMFIEADRLVHDTENLLSELQGFCGLDRPFTEEYRIFQKTGEKGSGDPSENIFSGRVKRNRGISETELLSDISQSVVKSHKNFMGKISTIRSAL